jgi:hypothetical protein
MRRVPGKQQINKTQIHIENNEDSQALVAHACNPSYSGAEIRRIAVQSQLRQIIHKTLS